MKAILALFFVLLFPIYLSAQIYWADEVLDFSTEYDDKKWSADQILGKPNKYPDYGSSPVAWSPFYTNSAVEFVVLGYETEPLVDKILIFETFNPGSLIAVLVETADGEKVFIKGPKREGELSAKSRVLILELPSPMHVKSLRMNIEPRKISGYNQIDAVGLSLEKKPSLPGINLSKELTERPLLVENISSSEDELNPILTANGNFLYYTKKDKSLGDEIWYSALEDSLWSLPIKLPSPVNNKGDNYVCGSSPDGRTILVGGDYLPGQKKDKLFMFTIENDEWFGPYPMVIKDYYNRSKTQSFSVSAGGRTLLMSVERDNSLGSQDLYVSFKQEDKTWSRPKHLGKQINSAGKEITPFLAPDQKTLYFSSDGFPGYGSNDIFVTKRLDDTWTNWSEPLNLGKPINSFAWDAYFVTDANGEMGYFSAYRGKIKDSEIYSVALNKEQKPEETFIVKGFIRSEITNESLPGVLRIKGLEGEFEAKADNSGYFEIIRGLGESIEIDVLSPGYMPSKQRIRILQDRQIEVLLQPLKIGAVIPLDELSFEANSTGLRNDSKKQLDRMAQWLKLDTELGIEIAGHTNNICEEKYCLELSESRAKTVMNYLVSAGVPEKQLEFKGYGSAEPIAKNESAEGRKLNQRVEFRVISLD